MPTHVFIGFLFLVGAMALGIFVSDRARRVLTPEQKAKLLDTLHSVRKYAIILVIGYAVVAYQKPVLSWIIPAAAICIASIYVLKIVAVSRASLPEAYRRASTIEARIVFAGILLFVAVALWPMYGA